ncbi:MAG: hypothetical protein COY38_01195 [Candidatus Aenigmarchaeota archaeon CG_4_10_14_0_8_um_filter_37_24]|nr:tetratricopeptide repeat protein [Candidatus Aenigmarchaeota archaeon]OIN85695.1 MAG: hypothetical protein AUJ50_04745 [Candidatus Aenigmarchaeota archaeon CG1_02_38_14]PIV68730.1 MAG: hypothetical protein COS07_03150 [Candidatus Aenigmarchaeota archaeon CG01_land_8_20_14_3_00_37_9]PIW40818.1 MAG: hypothetical protein COW21_05070 [Candidatus Aenigmarchaeota archaeon CG15_BIG_FIL_POST_REV_8_21_14_020_37_27]PIX50493.1 MAG: hypothetical protein COZ52_03810 [Candidatus Aenigmarchaeota archaeon C
MKKENDPVFIFIAKTEGDLKLRFLINKARVMKNQMGDYEGAMEVIEEILELSPNNRDGLLLKAGAFGELGMLKDQEKILNKIIKLYPENAEVYCLMAMKHFRINEDEEAMKYIDMSLEKGENFDNLITKAQFLHLMSGKENYRKYLKKAEKIDKKRLENFMKNIWISKEEYDKIAVPNPKLPEEDPDYIGFGYHG